MSVVEMKVPTIGESVTEVTLSQWLVEDGDYVEMDEPICEFESDKATLEFPAETAGKLIHVASEGDDLEIGELVAKIDTSASAPEKEEESEEEDKAEKEEKEEKGKPKDKEKAEEEPSADKDAGKEEEKEESYAKGHASPAAAKLMREHDLEASDIDGTGKDGRITKGDVQKALEEKEEAEDTKKEKQKEEKEETKASKPSKKSEESEDSERAMTAAFSRETRRERMSRMRRTIAKRLVSAKNETAMLTTFNEIDMSAIMKLRKTYQDQFVEKYGIKLGFMSLFAKACAKVLMDMPDVNAILDENELVYHDYVDISIAISTENGLVVPPVHNVESLSFAEVERKIKELADKAREGSLSLEEMSGGTFTITNGGIFGSLMSTPIINEPQSAILGMHAIQQRPVAIDGEVVVRPMMYVALSYDHRVVDGSTSVTFLVKVKELLEDPYKWFLDI